MMINSRYKVRTSVIFSIFCFAYLVIIIALYTIQIRNRDFFINLGKQQYQITVTQNPPRGLIYDTNFKFLALNKDTLSAIVLPNALENKKQLEDFLEIYFPQALQRLKTNPHTQFMYIKRKLSQKELELLEKNNITDIKLLKEPNRFYPEKCMNQILGITDTDNMGLFGLELIYNKKLAGLPTTYYLEKDARSGHFYFKKETLVEGAEGESLQLTIDCDIQYLCYHALKKTVQKFKAQEGSVLVLDASNNHILAMVNYPTFNQDNITHLDLEKTKNKIVTEAYEPGSVMKAFAALALLEEGLVTPDELVDCENTIYGKINGAKFTTTKAHGILSFADVIRHSNNIGIAKTATRLGPLLHKHYFNLGFGKKVLFDWPGQQIGYINPPHKWSRSSLVSLSFGYEVRTTLLHLAQAFSLVANDGKIVPFTLIKNEPMKYEELETHYSSKALNDLKAILSKTNAKPLSGYTIWGKTGTANLVIDGKYSYDHNIYIFVGVIEKDTFKRIIVTFIKDIQRKDLLATNVAVPLFDTIAQDIVVHNTMHNKE